MAPSGAGGGAGSSRSIRPSSTAVRTASRGQELGDRCPAEDAGRVAVRIRRRRPGRRARRRHGRRPRCRWRRGRRGAWAGHGPDASRTGADPGQVAGVADGVSVDGAVDGWLPLESLPSSSPSPGLCPSGQSGLVVVVVSSGAVLEPLESSVDGSVVADGAVLARRVRAGRQDDGAAADDEEAEREAGGEHERRMPPGHRPGGRGSRRGRCSAGGGVSGAAGGGMRGSMMVSAMGVRVPAGGPTVADAPESAHEDRGCHGSVARPA